MWFKKRTDTQAPVLLSYSLCVFTIMKLQPQSVLFLGF